MAHEKLIVFQDTVFYFTVVWGKGQVELSGRYQVKP